MSSTVTLPLGWEVAIEIPAALARRVPASAVEQHIDFRFVQNEPPPLAPPTHQMRYDRQGRARLPARPGRMLDELS